jgi:nitrogen PTS system EIIA component
VSGGSTGDRANSRGVAIPHGAIGSLPTQIAALLIVPEGVDFHAIDHTKVRIFFCVIGPKNASGEHLRTLARIARLLRSDSVRTRLVGTDSDENAYKIVRMEESQ